MKRRGALLAVLCCLGAVAASEVPVRLDLHLTGGRSLNLWDNFYEDPFDYAYIIDIDGKALVKKEDVRHKIPKKYERFVGDEIYVGHLLVPRTIMGSRNTSLHAWDFYIDWQPIGINLLSFPSRGTHAAPIGFQFTPSLALAYHLLKFDGKYYHHPNAGLDVRAEFRARVSPRLSIKLTAFQKLFAFQFKEEIGGKKQATMPYTTGVAAGFILHIPMTRRI